MTRYRVLLFDLFDTLVDFHWDRLPAVSVNGQVRYSTGPFVYPLLTEAFGPFDLERFQDAFLESYREAERRREQDLRETTSEERFRILFEMLGIPLTQETQPLLLKVVARHMEKMALAMELPPENKALLTDLGRAYRLGLVSNFDHGPTARRILGEFGIADLFAAVVISGEIGWRKPHPEVFHTACRLSGVREAEALFIGDSLTIDVAGAKGVGMDAVWLNRRGLPASDGLPAPDYTITRLAELTTILRVPAP